MLYFKWFSNKPHAVIPVTSFFPTAFRKLVKMWIISNMRRYLLWDLGNFYFSGKEVFLHRKGRPDYGFAKQEDNYCLSNFKETPAPPKQNRANKMQCNKLIRWRGCRMWLLTWMDLEHNRTKVFPRLIVCLKTEFSDRSALIRELVCRLNWVNGKNWSLWFLSYAASFQLFYFSLDKTLKNRILDVLVNSDHTCKSKNVLLTC